MLLQKTLHLGRSVEECKARLGSIHSYRRYLLGVTKALVTSSRTLDFSFRGPLGFRGHTVLMKAASPSPAEVAFESVGGNIDIMGLVEFSEVRPDFTEITLAVHYEIKNKLFAWLDRRLGIVDAFLNSELRSLRSHFEGIAAPSVRRAVLVPLLEPAAA